MVPLTQINDFIRNLDSTGDGFNKLSVEGDTSFILSSGGDVYSWGGNTNGKAGLGSASYTDTPTLVTSLKGKSIASVVGGRNSTYYISHTGDVYFSGDNAYGQSGMGESHKDTIKVTTPVKIDSFKFSATELPPDAPGSMEHPDEVETEQQIEIHWDKVSNAAGYELKRYFTPVQSTFGIMTVGEEATEVVYSGNGNSVIDTAPSEAGTLTYSVKALNIIGDYSAAKSSNAINVLENSGVNNDDDNNNNNNNNNDNNNNGNNNDSNNNNNNNGGGLTDEQLLQIISALQSGGIDDDLIAALVASNKRSNSSGDVNVNVPSSGTDDNAIAALIAAMNERGQGVNGQSSSPSSNTYNQGMSVQDMAELIQYLGESKLDDAKADDGLLPIEHYVIKLMFDKMFPPDTQNADVSEPPASEALQQETGYYAQQQNDNQRYINVAVISAILVLILIGFTVKFIPEVLKYESEQTN